MNENIIPYVPIADRVQATNNKSQLLCQQFFHMVDRLVKTQITFNHDTTHGFLSICPDQINDLIDQLSKTDHLDKFIDIKILSLSLNDLIYPKFLGEHTITSPIWNNTSVVVWQFQLNQIARDKIMLNNTNDIEQNLDMALSSIRVWRNSLEAAGNDKQVTYCNNDLIYQLMDLELKLQTVQNAFDD
ncbi:hypothetical protein N5J44_00090 [Acinetobacter ursingii]|uniref:hypothetical protein n=1 Tax=Acinetobacter ursingii TaxID=108980 RepID=UPI002446E6DE|nr:hypothetical protein [Acinetobacter ursingii]MDH2017877.1 hypothetical protein [Acinetobacter ursingii]MDH2069962.1 hypothetical protein [Acinetobacter ursingii]